MIPQACSIDLNTMDDDVLQVLAGEENVSIAIVDNLMEENMVEIEDQPNWLNLPDLVFNKIMMMTSMASLRRCTQVCSSWDERITKNILESPKSIIRARIERAMAMGPGMFPSSEDICNAKWLSK